MPSLVKNSRNMKHEKVANLNRKIDRDALLRETTNPPPQKMQRQDVVKSKTTPVELSGKRISTNKKSRFIQSNPPLLENKEKDTETQKSTSETESNQCGNSSAHIATIIKKVSDLENKLKTEKFKNEKKEEIENEAQSKDQIICDLELKAIESENTMNILQKEISKHEDSMSKILEEKEQWENKLIKSQEFANNLKQGNEEQKTQNQILEKWKETEVKKLKESLKLRFSKMIEETVAKDKLYQQKILNLENLLNQKAAQ